MGYNKLERNLIDIIKEEQAKLGFFREDIRLYYPLSSLNTSLMLLTLLMRCRHVLKCFLLLLQTNSETLRFPTRATASVSIFHSRALSMCIITLPEMNLSRSLSIWSADMAVPWMKSWICSILILIMSLQKKWTTGNSTA